MELILIEIGSPEWDFIWNWLASHPINKDLPEPSVALNEGEAWQYMGSYRQGERILHSFRHRCHPKTSNVMTLSVHASPNITPEQIQKKFRL